MKKKPEESSLSYQNIKDRFYGTNDPVAEKLLRRFVKIKQNENTDQQDLTFKSSDLTIRTLYIGGIDETFEEKDILKHFSPFGSIINVNMISKKGYCLITFKNRKDAENAIDSLHDCLFIRNKRIKLTWAKSKIANDILKNIKSLNKKKTSTSLPILTNKNIHVNSLNDSTYDSMKASYGAAKFQ